MTDVIGYVLNTNGVSLAPDGDSEYIEVPSEDEDFVVESVLSGEEDDALDSAVRQLTVADLVAVYDAAKALMYSERTWGRRATEREALAVAVAEVSRRR